MWPRLSLMRCATIFGFTMPKTIAPLPDWELVLSSTAISNASCLMRYLSQERPLLFMRRIVFRGTLTTYCPIYGGRFDEVLMILESVAGRKTPRLQRPVQILGSRDGIETGVRLLIRDGPLKTTVVNYHGDLIRSPTEGEILRIKSVLILKRNATRDYLDFVALA